MATPTPVFPAAVATDAQLKVANNQIQATLKVDIDGANTILFVDSVAGFAANSLISVEKEIMAVASVSSTPNPSLTVAAGGRGFDGTSAVPHKAGVKVAMYIDAWHHNALAAEVKAIEQFLGPNGQNVGSGNEVWSNQYQFTSQPGGSLVPGNNAITLSPVPEGVNGTDTNHWLYVSGGTGAPEAVKITGGTAVAGAPSGQLIIQCANAHSGAWTLSSASAGIMEAIVANNGQGVINLPAGPSYLYATLVLPTVVSLRGQGAISDGSVNVNTRLICAAGVSPGIAVADGRGTATGQGLGTHSGYHLYGAGTGTGLWIGGDPANVFCPASWYGSFTRYVDLLVSNFSHALHFQSGNFLSFHRSDFNGLSRALYVPASAAGMQPTGFYDCLLTVPSGAAVEMNSSNFQTASLFYCGGQVSGTITGAAVDWQSIGTHYEPNAANDPIVDISGSQAGIVKIFGGLCSTHGPSPPFHIRMNSSQWLVLHVKDVTIMCDSGATVGTFVNYGSSFGGILTLENIIPTFAGTFTNLYQLSGSALPYLQMSIALNQYTARVDVAAAATLVFPNGNYPNRGLMAVTGATIPGAGITAVSGLLPAQSGVLLTRSAQTFTAGATIGNTITLTASVPYTYYFDGLQIWIR